MELVEMSSQTNYGWFRAMHVMNHHQSSGKRESVVEVGFQPEKYLCGGL
jgi:hypothetical protein